MKVWADFSSLVRVAMVCVLVGFILGLFVACSVVREPVTTEMPAQTLILGGSAR